MNEARGDIAHPGSSPRILVVEDEPDLALLLAYNLEEGYVAESVERGDEAELRLAEDPPDLVILDWMLPGLSGIEICRRLRLREATRTLPVIMVTGRGEEAERVRGLSVGADDYVVKPFSVPELMARVHALLRRSRPERIAERLYFGDLELDRVTQRVRRSDRDIHLGPTDFRLLEYISLRNRDGCSLVLSSSTAFGGIPWKSKIVRSTRMSGGCARRCRRGESVIRSAPCGGPTTPSTKPLVEQKALSALF